jgi:hypothetical protein
MIAAWFALTILLLAKKDIAKSRSVRDYQDRTSYSETVMRWQSLSYGPNYNSAYCIAVCPAGEDVLKPYLEDRKAHLQEVVRPLQDKIEPIYVAKGTDAANHVARRFPHKHARFVRPSGRATNISNFLAGIRLSFQPGMAQKLDATYHFTFTGAEQARSTITIRDCQLRVLPGHQGQPNLRVVADSRTWIRFLNHEVSILRCLVTLKIRLSGPPQLLIDFGRCFPT